MTLLQISGSPTMAPIYFSNAASFPSWSGKPAAALPADDVLDILDFCRDEGRRFGWNDAVQGVANERNEADIFDPVFLRGYPAYWWAANYRYARRLFEAGHPNLVTEDRRVA